MGHFPVSPSPVAGDFRVMGPLATEADYPSQFCQFYRMILSRNIPGIFFSTFKLASHIYLSSTVKLFTLLARCSKKEPYYRREKTKISFTEKEVLQSLKTKMLNYTILNT